VSELGSSLGIGRDRIIFFSRLCSGSLSGTICWGSLTCIHEVDELGQLKRSLSSISG
jgi:hypothetical protein